MPYWTFVIKSLLALLLVLVLQPCLTKDIDETTLIYRDDIAYDSRTNKLVTGRVVKFYKNGKRDGLWEWFDREGKLIKAYTHKDGKKVEEREY